MYDYHNISELFVKCIMCDCSCTANSDPAGAAKTN